MIETLVRDEPAPRPQEGEAVLFQRRQPKDSDLRLANLASLNDFFHFIRMLDAHGYLRAFVDIQDHRVEFSDVKYENGALVGVFTLPPNSDGS